VSWNDTHTHTHTHTDGLNWHTATYRHSL